MNTCPRILLFTDDKFEIRSWEAVFDGHATYRAARSLAELIEVLHDDIFDAVFCGWSNPAGTWLEVLHQVQLRWVDLPVIIYSRTASELEWLKVLDAGAFDLLVAPYQKCSVLPVLEQAVTSYYARRFQNTELAKAIAS